jgi:starvation-inducible DNA-binding protein
LFDQVAEHIEDHVDTLAERITALGGTANGTIAAVSRTSTLAPYPDDISDGIEHTDALSSAVATFGAKVRGTRR